MLCYRGYKNENILTYNCFLTYNKSIRIYIYKSSGNGGGGGGRVALYLINENYAYIGEVNSFGGEGTAPASGLTRHGHPGIWLQDFEFFFYH